MTAVVVSWRELVGIRSEWRRRQWHPLQYFCLENPTDGGAWWAAVHGVARVGHDWATSLSLFTFMRWRRKWQPTPVFLPGESQGWEAVSGVTQSRTRLKQLSRQADRQEWVENIKNILDVAFFKEPATSGLTFLLLSLGPRSELCLLQLSAPWIRISLNCTRPAIWVPCPLLCVLHVGSG